MQADASPALREKRFIFAHLLRFDVKSVTFTRASACPHFIRIAMLKDKGETTT